MLVRKSRFALLVPAALFLGACAGESPTTAAAGGEANAAALAPAPVCLEFNVPALGSQWGGGLGTVPGALIFVENGIRVYTSNWTNGVNTFYGLARIELPPQPFGAGATGLARSIVWGFDFGVLPFVARAVRFEWLDPSFTTLENLRVNGNLFIGQIHAPPAVLGGLPVSASSVAVPGGRRGTITVGPGAVPVTRIEVGGQPMWVDRVCAYP
jgi:hypothetical protein